MKWKRVVNAKAQFEKIKLFVRPYIRPYPILVSVVGVLLIVDILIRFYFHNYVHWDWDTFAKYGAPIAEIISAVVVAFALLFSFNQNRTLKSANAKPSYEKRIGRLKKLYKSDDTLPVYKPLPTATNVKPDPVKPTYKTLIRHLHIVRNNLYGNIYFTSDLLVESESGRMKTEHYQNQVYFPLLQFLVQVANDSLNFYVECIELSMEIRDSKDLTRTDKRLLIREIGEKYLHNYIHFFAANDFDKSFFLIPWYPDAKPPENLVPWVQFHQTRFRRLSDIYLKEIVDKWETMR